MDMHLPRHQDASTASFRAELRAVDEVIGATPVQLQKGAQRSLNSALLASRRMAWGSSVLDPIAETVLGSRSLVTVGTRLAEWGVAVLGPLSGGAGSVVLDAGANVVRIGFGSYVTPPAIPEMNQPIFGETIGALRVEVYPKADTNAISEDDVQEMCRVLSAIGYEFSDPGTDNLGRVGGRLVVIDPGAISVAKRPASRPDVAGYTQGGV